LTFFVDLKQVNIINVIFKKKNKWLKPQFNYSLVKNSIRVKLLAKLLQNEKNTTTNAKKTGTKNSNTTRTGFPTVF